jgi:hypothetical protein
MPEIVPDQVDRIIYLDSDLVLKRTWVSFGSGDGHLPALAVQSMCFLMYPVWIGWATLTKCVVCHRARLIAIQA